MIAPIIVIAYLDESPRNMLAPKRTTVSIKKKAIETKTDYGSSSAVKPATPIDCPSVKRPSRR